MPASPTRFRPCATAPSAGLSLVKNCSTASRAASPRPARNIDKSLPAMPVASPTRPWWVAPRWQTCSAGSRSRPAALICSMYAPPKNSKPVTCPPPAPHPAVNWCRKPTISPVCAAHVWCWSTTMACGPTCRRPGSRNWAGKCMCLMTCSQRTSAKKVRGRRPSPRHARPRKSAPRRWRSG
ncbi:hypothetical protein D3C85_1219770 [compost metagenome]